MTDLTRTPKRLSDMDKKKEIVGSSDTPVITDKKVTTTPQTTSIGATPPSQSEEEYNENPQTPQTPPQTMPAQPQPTQVPPTAPSLAAQPQGEEYNETPQAPPTTPAPAVTTTSTIQPPQNTDTDTDRRNQANLAAQTTTAPTANENMILQFDKENKPVLVNADVATPTISPKTTDPTPATDATPATEGEEFRSYRDILAKYAPLTSDEDKRKQMRRERRKAIVSALGDGLSALSNLYFTTKGAPDQGLKPGMTESAKKRMDDLRTQWQKEKDKYQDLMLKGLEMDREQGNWLKLYELQKNEEERKQKKFEQELPLLEKKVQAAEEELKKLIRENNVGDATWQQSVEVAKQELAWKKYELEFMKTHKGYKPKEWEEHLATERYRNRTLADKSGKGGGEKSGGNIIMSTQSGYAYNPTDAQVRQAYRWLQSRHFVSGNAKSISEMVAELQNYYTVSGENRNIYDGESIEKSRLDDIKGGPRVDAMLGGKTRGDGSTMIDAAIGGGSGALLDGLL